jgi:hypothetical protein
LKSPRNDTGIAMTNLHRSPPMNQSNTDLGIVNESQLLRFGISACFALKASSKFVMPGLVPGIHVFGASKKGVDGRDKPGHDVLAISRAVGLRLAKTSCYQPLAQRPRRQP